MIRLAGRPSGRRSALEPPPAVGPRASPGGPASTLPQRPAAERTPAVPARALPQAQNGVLRSPRELSLYLGAWTRACRGFTCAGSRPRPRMSLGGGSPSAGGRAPGRPGQMSGRTDRIGGAAPVALPTDAWLNVARPPVPVMCRTGSTLAGSNPATVKPVRLLATDRHRARSKVGQAGHLARSPAVRSASSTSVQVVLPPAAPLPAPNPTLTRTPAAPQSGATPRPPHQPTRSPP